MLNVGDPAPDFELPAADGSTVRLKDLRGRKVVLYFYPKDDTPGCTAESCSFQENLDVVTSKGALVIGVSADDVVSHKKFAGKFGLTFPLLSDTEKTVIRAYDVWKERSMYGRLFMGIQRSTFVIDERGIIRKIFEKVKVKGHTNEVLEALS